MCRSKLASEPSFPRFVLSARRLISDKASLKRLLQALLALHGTWGLAASASPDRFASVCHRERGFPDIRQKQEVAALAPVPGTLQRLHLLTGYRFESLDSEIGGHQIWPCCDAGVDASGLSKAP